LKIRQISLRRAETTAMRLAVMAAFVEISAPDEGPAAFARCPPVVRRRE
jgi:hypothetical protein